jgi:hypothetical protein
LFLLALLAVPAAGDTEAGPICDGKWREYETGLPDGNAAFLGAAVIDTQDAWAVGFRRTETGSREPLIERFDGTAWSQVEAPTVGKGSAQLNDVDAISHDDAWAVGNTNRNGRRGTFSLHWDGSSWSRVPAPSPTRSELRGVSMAATDDVWAVGTHAGTSGALRTLAEHWDGTAWSELAIPDQGPEDSVLRGVSAASASFALAVGIQAGSEGPFTIIEQWDGSRWSRLGNAEPGTLEGVWALRREQAWAGGPPARHLVDGSWSDTPLPWNDLAVNGVSGRSRTGVWAAGNRPLGDGTNVAAITRWNGETWLQSNAPIPPGAGGSTFEAVAASEPFVWAVGYRTPDTLTKTALIFGVC